jgi:hypothetical protein
MAAKKKADSTKRTDKRRDIERKSKATHRAERRAAGQLEAGERRKVFCGSMMDFFDKNAPEGAREGLWEKLADMWGVLKTLYYAGKYDAVYERMKEMGC